MSIARLSPFEIIESFPSGCSRSRTSRYRERRSWKRAPQCEITHLDCRMAELFRCRPQDLCAFDDELRTHLYRIDYLSRPVATRFVFSKQCSLQNAYVRFRTRVSVACHYLLNIGCR